MKTFMSFCSYPELNPMNIYWSETRFEKMVKKNEPHVYTLLHSYGVRGY
jgi:hypothetical protein